MENASKALVMAGSVLLAILIIALGMTIFNTAKNSADTTALDATEVSMFNSKFERYSGNQLGSQVKSLISFAVSNASTNAEEPIKLPTVYYHKEDGSLGEIATMINPGGGFYGSIDTFYIDKLSNIRNILKSTHTYNVILEYGESGIVDKITIKY